MSYTYVGVNPGCLATGRPLWHGDVVDSVEEADYYLLETDLLVENKSASPTIPDPPKEV